MYMRNIFIYNARKEDRIVINDEVVKERQGRSPQGENIRGDLRIIFMEDYNKAVQQGMLERLDGVLVNVDEHRSKGKEVEYRLLGRSRAIKLEIR